MQELIETLRLKIQIARFQELGPEWRRDSDTSRSAISHAAGLDLSDTSVCPHRGKLPQPTSEILAPFQAL